MQPKWQLSAQRCRENGDHPQEDLAKCGYKSDMKYKNFKQTSLLMATYPKPNIEEI